MTEIELIESWPKTYTYADEYEFDLTIKYYNFKDFGEWYIEYDNGDGWQEGPTVSAPTLKQAILEFNKLIKNE